MAILERAGTRARSHLHARHLIGRSSLAQLRLSDPSVSGEHSVVGWNGTSWEVHDLGSRNGTTVDGRRLAPGERVVVTRGAMLGFGSQGSTWRLVDDAPPAVMALPEGGGEPIVGEYDLLALPDSESPEVTLYRHESEWVLDQGDTTSSAAHGQKVTVGGRCFTLVLPDVVSPTLEARSAPLTLDSITLSFRVSRDEEHIELTALGAGREIDLGARAHHSLLLMLARARLRDRAENVVESSAGWVYQEDVAKGLGLDEPHLNVVIFRCRQQMASSGIASAAEIVERRKSARQLRIGAAQLELQTV